MAENMQVLHYEYVDDILERRKPHREEHLSTVRKWHGDGRLVLAGALGDPPRGALLVFRTSDPAEVEAFVDNDPYFSAGLITRWWIEPCAVVT